MRRTVTLGAGFIISLLMAGNVMSAETAANGRHEAAAAPSAKTMTWSFDRDKSGGVPAGTEVYSGSWAVREEPDPPSLPQALCQTESAPFPALSLTDTVYTDVTVVAHFKAISGNGDRAAGIIFRIQDKDNYYILRANALEDNVNLYKYVDGARHVLKEGSAKVVSGSWQQLRVEVSGETIRGYLDGRLVVETRDGTFKDGKIGLWTKSDSVTCFDDVAVTVPKTTDGKGGGQ